MKKKTKHSIIVCSDGFDIEHVKCGVKSLTDWRYHCWLNKQLVNLVVHWMLKLTICYISVIAFSFSWRKHTALRSSTKKWRKTDQTILSFVYCCCTSAGPLLYCCSSDLWLMTTENKKICHTYTCKIVVGSPTSPPSPIVRVSYAISRSKSSKLIWITYGRHTNTNPSQHWLYFATSFKEL